MSDEDWVEVPLDELENEQRIYQLHASLGNFIVAFSKVELALTVILAELCKQRDFVRFQILTKGLDARAKAGRIRELSKIKSQIQKGSHFDKHLEMFSTKINDFRNAIAHSFLTFPTDKPIMAFYDITYLTEDPKSAEHVTNGEAIDLYTEWVDAFFSDLLDVVKLARDGKELLIDRPKSMEPQEFHQRVDALNRDAKRAISPKIAPSRGE